MVSRERGSDRKPFWGCEAYPRCRGTRDIDCPECKDPLVEREGKYGSFWGCSRFPHCRYIYRVDKGVTRDGHPRVRQNGDSITAERDKETHAFEKDTYENFQKNIYLFSASHTCRDCGAEIESGECYCYTEI